MGVATEAVVADVAGWLTSWPEYISTPVSGLAVGMARAVVGFGGGLWRRRAQFFREFQRNVCQIGLTAMIAGVSPIIPITYPAIAMEGIAKMMPMPRANMSIPR